MKQLITDTDPQIQSIQDALLRRQSVQEKFRMLSSLTHTVIHHAKRSIRRNNPEMTDREVELRFVQLHYGDELARGVSNLLNERES